MPIGCHSCQAGLALDNSPKFPEIVWRRKQRVTFRWFCISRNTSWTRLSQTRLIRKLNLMLSCAVNSKMLYYRPERSCGQGNVFTAVCDSVHRGGLRQGEPPPGRRTPLEGEPPLPWKENPHGKENPPTPPLLGRRPPPPSIRSMSSRYASYWNAFLFIKWLIQSIFGLANSNCF